MFPLELYREQVWTPGMLTALALATISMQWHLLLSLYFEEKVAELKSICLILHE